MKMTEVEMADYYAKRTSEYEDIYLKPERQSDLKQLKKTLSEAFQGLDLFLHPRPPCPGQDKVFLGSYSLFNMRLGE